jgi:hypothetical protein
VILVAGGESADQSPEQLRRIRDAVTDARRELPTAQIIDAPAAEPHGTAASGLLMRLAERYARMPGPVAAGR